MFLVNSHPGHFTVTAFCFLSRRQITYSRHLFSRSYEAILPSSLTRVRSSTLGYSPHLPVSVCGTVTQLSRIEVFLGSMLIASLCPYGLPIAPRSMSGRICLPAPPTRLDRHNHPPAGIHFCVTPYLITVEWWYGDINPFSITYAFRPQLRDRLTLSGLTFLRKP